MKQSILLLLVLLVGCEHKPYDEKYVKMQDGKIFRLENTIGDNYFLHPVDTTAIQINFK